MEEKKEPRGTFSFECGACYQGVQDPTPVSSHVDKKGRARLCVYDSEGDENFRRPMLDGKMAPCRFGCPCKRAGGRKEERAFPDDYEEREEFCREQKSMIGHWRTIITCYGTFKPAEDGEIFEDIGKAYIGGELVPLKERNQDAGRDD